MEQLIARAAEWAMRLSPSPIMDAYRPSRCISAARKHGIKVIYGVEGYLYENDIKEKPYHVIILARSLEGLHNLYRLVTLSYLTISIKTGRASLSRTQPAPPGPVDRQRLPGRRGISGLLQGLP